MPLGTFWKKSSAFTGLQRKFGTSVQTMKSIMKLIKGKKSGIVIEIHDIKILMIFKKFMKSMNSRNP